jgi:hypothetical protein
MASRASRYAKPNSGHEQIVGEMGSTKGKCLELPQRATPDALDAGGCGAPQR